MCVAFAVRFPSKLYFAAAVTQCGAIMRWLTRTPVTVVLLILFTSFTRLQAADSALSFQEVYELLKQQLVNAEESRLNRAAALGLIRQLSPQVRLVTNGMPAPRPGGPLLAASRTYDGSFGYLRIGHVETGLADEVAAAIVELTENNKIKGWILDLRFGGGQDYKEATAVAQKFIATEQPLLDWGQGEVRAKSNKDAIKTPLAILVNRETAAAAEALAAILRKANVALILGTNTAGHAFIMKEFPLKSGQQLRIATALIKVGDGDPLSVEGLSPDIQVGVNPAVERLYLEDPYAMLPTTISGSETNLLATATNRPARHRINEAELVRLLREGRNPDEETNPAPSLAVEPARNVVRDPALARALDLLKGLAVVKFRRP